MNSPADLGDGSAARVVNLAAAAEQRGQVTDEAPHLVDRAHHVNRLFRIPNTHGLTTIAEYGSTEVDPAEVGDQFSTSW